MTQYSNIIRKRIWKQLLHGLIELNGIRRRGSQLLEKEFRDKLGNPDEVSEVNKVLNGTLVPPDSATVSTKYFYKPVTNTNLYTSLLMILILLIGTKIM